MDFWYSAEMEGELLLIGIIAIIAVFFYHKLDQWMQLHEKTNELLKELIDEKKSNEKQNDNKEG